MKKNILILAFLIGFVFSVFAEKYKLSEDFLYDVSRGLERGHEIVTWGGVNTDVDLSGVYLNDWGGTFTFMTNAQTIRIYSSSTNDTYTGTGAKVLLVGGLSSNWLEQTEGIAMGGTGYVTTVNAYLRINQLQVVIAGSGHINDGNITAEALQPTTNTQMYITSNTGIGMRGGYAVPKNKILHVLSTDISFAPPSGSATFSSSPLLQLLNFSLETDNFVTASLSPIYLTGSKYLPMHLEPLEGPMDFHYFIGGATATNTIISVTATGILEEK